MIPYFNTRTTLYFWVTLIGVILILFCLGSMRNSQKHYENYENTFASGTSNSIHSTLTEKVIISIGNRVDRKDSINVNMDTSISVTPAYNITRRRHERFYKMTNSESNRWAAGSNRFCEIPNTVHYIHLTTSPTQLLFTEMVSILSSYKKQKPSSVYFYCNEVPTGHYWQELQQKVPVLRVVELDLKEYIHVDLKMLAHRLKLEALIAHGGIAVDLSVIFIQSLDPIRNLELVRSKGFAMGREKQQKLNAGVVMACQSSRFLWMYYNKSLTVGENKGLEYIRAVLPFMLYEKYPEYIYVEQGRLVQPVHRHALFADSPYLSHWRTVLTVDLQMTPPESRVYDDQYIRPLRSLVAKLLRFIYYGSADEISKYSPWVMYSATTA